MDYGNYGHKAVNFLKEKSDEKEWAIKSVSVARSKVMKKAMATVQEVDSDGEQVELAFTTLDEHEAHCKSIK